MAFSGKIIENKIVGQQLKFLRVAKETQGEFLEIEMSYSGKSIPPIPHYHPNQEEWFTVLEGELTVRIDGEIRKLKAGEKIYIPKNKVHSMWSEGASKTSVNWIVKPALKTEYFFETAYGLAKAGKVNTKGVPSVFQSALLAMEYSDEFQVATIPRSLQKIIFPVLGFLGRIKGLKGKYAEFMN